MNAMQLKGNDISDAQTKQQDRLLTAEDVLKLTGLKSRVTLWRKSRDDDDPFPLPYRFGPQSKRWKLSELNAWMNELETV